MDAFLDSIQAMGFDVKVAITDGSPLYKEALIERWQGLEHQLCVFHVIKEINALVLQALRQLRVKLPKPKKYRRGRPSKRGRKRKKDTRRKFVQEHQHLLVKREDRWTDEDRANWQQLVEYIPEAAVLRDFVNRTFSLFEPGITKQTASQRRRRLVDDPRYQNFPDLVKAIRKLSKEKFAKMITFLGWSNVDRTNNHVERNNRIFRFVQKTRYKRRRRHTILQALWLHILLRWRRHPFYDLNAERLAGPYMIGPSQAEERAA